MNHNIVLPVPAPAMTTDWPMFWVSVASAALTLAALVVAIVTAVRAARRANAAEQELRAIESRRLRIEVVRLEREKAQLEGEIPTVEEWLKNDTDYGDHIRAAKRQSELAGKRGRIEEIQILLDGMSDGST